ncbi:MAG: threonine aldolase family protein [Phycisphaerales bacterium]
MSATAMIDLRSDTVTKPTKDMLRAMTSAELGDDVLGDEPTVIRLQERCAELMGKEAACFVPSGTMGNLTSIRALTEPGDEIIAHTDSHIFHYETGGYAAIAGCSMRHLSGARGQFDADDVEAAVRPPNAHFPHSALVVIENTQNRGGGSIWPIERIDRVVSMARAHGMKVHLDGARLWNACAATGLEPSAYARHFDTVTSCFSKGLGTPAGSIVAGSDETIRRVHRFRKMLGGAMRQSGVLAAAALHALDHHRERLADDHARARKLAAAIANMPKLSIDPDAVETNIVYFDVDRSFGSASEFTKRLATDGVRMLPTGPRRVRAVVSLAVTADDIDRAIDLIGRIAGAPRSAPIAN